MTHTFTHTVTYAYALLHPDGSVAGIFSGPEDAFAWQKEHGPAQAAVLEFTVDHPDQGPSEIAREDL